MDEEYPFHDSHILTPLPTLHVSLSAPPLLSLPMSRCPPLPTHLLPSLPLTSPTSLSLSTPPFLIPLCPSPPYPSLPLPSLSLSAPLLVFRYSFLRPLTLQFLSLPFPTSLNTSSLIYPPFLTPPLPPSLPPSSSACTQVCVASQPAMPLPVTPPPWTLVPPMTSAPTYWTTDPRTTMPMFPWGPLSPSSLIRTSELSTSISYLK